MGDNVGVPIREGNLEQIFDERVHCWYPECRRWARLQMTGFGCQGTAYCIPHFLKDLLSYIGYDRAAIWRTIHRR